MASPILPRSSPVYLISHINEFLKEDNVEKAYVRLQTLLASVSPDQDLKDTIQTILRVLSKLSLADFKKCTTDNLSHFLESTLQFPLIQYDLAIFISRRFLNEKELKQSMHYAAIALNIALEHNLDPLSAETLQAKILLTFLQEAHPKIKKQLEKVKFDPSLFLSELEKFQQFLIFCRTPEQLNSVVSLYEIAERIKANLNPAAARQLAGCQETLITGLALEQNPPHLFSLTRQYRQVLQDYRFTYEPYPPIREFQEEQTRGFICFLSLIINSTFLMLGPPPCGYDFCAMGSLGRGEPTPYSDLEWILLIEHDEELPYFERWIDFLELQILSLGETPSQFIPHFPCSPVKKGLSLDCGDASLIGTPEKLINAHIAPIIGNSLVPRTMPYTINQLRSIHSNTDLLSCFIQRRNEVLTSALRLERGKDLLKVRTEEWNKKAHSLSTSLKEDYIEPLFCPISDLALMLGIEETNTLDILGELEKRQCFSTETSLFLERTIQSLYRLRASQAEDTLLDTNSLRPLTRHLKSLKSIDAFLLSPLYKLLNSIDWEDAPQIDLFEKALLSEPSPDAITSLVQIFKRLEFPQETIKRYYIILSQNLNSIECLRTAYLNALDDFHFSEELSLIPTPFGERQIESLKRTKIQEILKSLTDSEPHLNKDNYQVRLIVPFPNEPLYLRTPVLNTILDEEGNIRKTCQQTMSRVSFFADETGNSLHFKQQPINPKEESPFHPGREFAASSLMFRLFGRGTSVGELVQFVVDNPVRKTSSTYLVFISETIPGKTLDKTLEESPATLDKLDPIQLSEMFLALPLLLPGDMRPANCIVTPSGEDSFQLISIDNDVSWVKPLTRSFFKGIECNLYTILPFLFPDFILAREAIDQFLSLRPGPILLSWFKSLEGYNTLIGPLFSNFSTPDFSPLCLFDRGTGVQLFAQFCALQAFLKKNQDRQIKGAEILQSLLSYDEGTINDVGSIIYNKYQAEGALSLTPSKKVQRVTGRANQSMSMTASQVTLLNQLPITDKERQNITPEKAFEEICGLVTLKFDGFSFHQEKDQVSKLEKGFKEIPDPVTQRMLLEVLAAHRYSRLNLSYNTVLTDEILEPFLQKSSDTLTSLNLSHCPQITEKSLPAIIRCQNLEELYLSHCPALKNFANFTGILFRTYFLASFAKLHTLHLSSSAALESIQIDAPELKTLKAVYCPGLKNYFLKIPQDTVISTRRFRNLPEPFGLIMWRKYFGGIGGTEPLLPPNIEEILNTSCPFWPEKKVHETHSLVFIPNIVYGKPFHLVALENLIQNPKTGFKTQYRYYDDVVKQKLGIKNQPAHWVLMTQDIIPGSKGKRYDAQKALVKKLALETGILYEIPTALEAATVILMKYVQTGTRIYEDNPLTYTLCQEKVDNTDSRVAIGSFSEEGPNICRSDFVGSALSGVGVLRKFY